MQKVKDFITSLNFNLLIFTTIGIRLSFFSASIGDAIVILALCGFQGYVKWLETQKTEPIEDKIREELDAIKSSVSNLVVKNSIRPQMKSENTQRFF